jgi:signal peptidase I
MSLRSFWEGWGSLILAIAVALAFRSFLFVPFYVPSESMLPTLLVGDHVFVNLTAYGPRVPGTELRLPGFREPQRGDIVVFTAARRGAEVYPADRRPDLPREDFVKRLIGLPGDRIAVENGVLRLNGEPVAVVDTGVRQPDGRGIEHVVQSETVGSCVHPLFDNPLQPPFDGREVTVEPGRYFFMGDNRDNSRDSRFWGTVRWEEIVGTATVLYWSWDFNGSWLSLLNPLTWIENLTRKTRWERFGDDLECGGDAAAPPAA